MNLEHRAVRAAATVVTMVAVFGCSSSSHHDASLPATTGTGSDPSTTTVLPDAGNAASAAAPCDLVTRADASAFLGGQVTRANSGQANKTCEWSRQLAHGRLMLNVFVDTNPFFYDPSKTAVTLPGIGDRAYVDTGAIGGPRFGVQKAKVIVTISLGGAVIGGGPKPWEIQTAARRAAFIALGKVAASRL